MEPAFLDAATFDFHEQVSSATIATGSLSAPDLPMADLDNKARVVCSTVDMGAYENRPRPPISVNSSSNPAAGGTTVTFNTALTGDCNVPSGAVTFYDGGRTLGTATLSSTAAASYATNQLTVGQHNVTVSYSGDFDFDSSTSAPLVQVITGYPTTTTLSASPNPATAFGTLTLSSTVTSSIGSPSGVVIFTANGAALATVPLNAKGQASATLSSLGTGSYAIVANYAANSTFATSSSVTINEVIVGSETTLALNGSPNPAIVGQAIRFSAAVKAAHGGTTPTGTVVVRDGATVLGTVSLDAAGIASFSTAALSPGVHSITAAYSGDLNFNVSTASVIETVNAISTALSLSATPNPAGFGQPVTLDATIALASSGSYSAGNVVFKDGGATIGTAVVDAADKAIFTTADLAVGTHVLTAVYSGNVSLGSSASAPVSETIIASDFSVTLTPATLALSSGQTGTVSVQLASRGSYAGTLSLSSTGLPANVTGSFGSSTLALRSNASAGTVLTLSTTVTRASLSGQPRETHTSLLALSLGALITPLCLFRRRTWQITLMLLALTVTLLNSTGCTTTGYAVRTVEPGTYHVMVNAVDASQNTRTASLSLIVTP